MKTLVVRHRKDSEGMLQFVRRGNVHVLKNVWAPGQEAGYQLAKLD